MKRKLSEFLAALELAGCLVPSGGADRAMSVPNLKSWLAHNFDIGVMPRAGTPLSVLQHVLLAYGFGVGDMELHPSEGSTPDAYIVRCAAWQRVLDLDA